MSAAALQTASGQSLHAVLTCGRWRRMLCRMGEALVEAQHQIDPLAGQLWVLSCLVPTPLTPRQWEQLARALSPTAAAPNSSPDSA